MGIPGLPWEKIRNQPQRRRDFLCDLCGSVFGFWAETTCPEAARDDSKIFALLVVSRLLGTALLAWDDFLGLALLFAARVIARRNSGLFAHNAPA